VKPRGNRIIATNISGRKVPPGPVRSEAVFVPFVPTVSVVVGADPPEVAVTLAGEKLQLASVGSAPQLKLNVPVNPPVGVTVMIVVPDEPDWMMRGEGEAASVKLGGGSVTT
jgi:hypothetical protein